MKTQSVFENDQELNRLATQNRLLRECEEPFYRRFFNGYHQLRLLDLGCNDGSKTVDRFDVPEIRKVVGLEIQEELAHRAQMRYGSEKFSFYAGNVEAPDFQGNLEQIMEREGVEAFDIISASFVLMHLKNPIALLKGLRRFLAPGGRIVIEEADDASSGLTPDADQLFRQFLQMLETDPWAGNRRCGEHVAGWMEQCGYRQVIQHPGTVRAGGEQTERKRDMFETFFSYLPLDMEILCREEPDNRDYAACVEWLRQHYEGLRAAAMSEGTEIAVGIRLIAGEGGERTP